MLDIFITKPYILLKDRVTQERITRLVLNLHVQSLHCEDFLENIKFDWNVSKHLACNCFSHGIYFAEAWKEASTEQLQGFMWRNCCLFTGFQNKVVIPEGRQIS